MRLQILIPTSRVSSIDVNTALSLVRRAVGPQVKIGPGGTWYIAEGRDATIIMKTLSSLKIPYDLQYNPVDRATQKPL